MNRKQVAVITSVATVCLLMWIAGVARGGDKTKTNGMIISRTGETLIVSGANGRTTVVLTDDTDTKDDTGLFGLGKEHLGATVLIPGLKVSVEGVPDSSGRVVATTITVDGDDLETAEMIQAGLHPTAQQVAENEQAIASNRQNISTNQQNIATAQQNVAGLQADTATHRKHIDQNIKDIQENSDRFSQLSDYAVKAQATVKFNVGSSAISQEDLDQLQQFARTATALTGYIIEVKGFADSSGNSIMNEKLSEDRAKAVVSYLIQQCNVPLRHIVAPGAMGEYQPAASNETAAGRAENRRVEVTALVNKGIAGI